MPEKHIRRHCKLGRAADTLLLRAQRELRISARGRSQILRVARTIADLDGAETISSAHLGEAVQYRMRDLVSGVG
jgi:magnesium chelatase family protein